MPVEYPESAILRLVMDRAMTYDSLTSLLAWVDDTVNRPESTSQIPKLQDGTQSFHLPMMKLVDVA